MSLPKEPRQKMINMMYLVLTAMLALNVSAEVLNAFKTVNTSINSANTTLTENSNTIYSSFADKLADAKTKAKAEIWKPKADQVQALSTAMYNRLESLKNQLKIEADYDSTKGEDSWNISDLNASARLFEKQGEGDKLHAELTKFKADLLAIDPEIAEEFANKLPINLDVPPSQTGTQKQTWAQSYFYMTPAIAALTILSKFQNDVKNTENQIITYCHNKIGEVTVRFDKFGFVGGLSSTYLMPGENLKVYAGVGATSSAAAPQVTINGRAVSLNSDGLAEVEIPGGGTGAHKVNVSIRYVDQDGQQQTINKVLDYAVGAPSGVSVSADKMNVLYIGVENPLTITAGVGSEKVNASFNAGTISRVRGSSWVAVPKTPGEHNINVNVDGKVTPIKFRVKHLPPPTAFIGGKQGGTVPSADFKVQGGVVARLLDSEFEVAYRVISYDVGALGGNYQTYQTSKNNGNRWSGDAGRIIENATPGTRIFIDNINVVGPDGRTQVLPALNFLLR